MQSSIQVIEKKIWKVKNPWRELKLSIYIEPHLNDTRCIFIYKPGILSFVIYVITLSNRYPEAASSSLRKGESLMDG